MRVIILGATGTAGGGILRACLDTPAVRDVRVVARHAPVVSHEKLTVFLHADYMDYTAVRDAFTGVGVCLYALGISVRQAPAQSEYRRITHDLAIAAARQLRSSSPAAVLHFVSGQGTRLDSRFMWARVKAETERDLAAITGTVCWRPGFIDGGADATGPRRYRALRPVFRLFGGVRRLYVTSEDIGHAMIEAASQGLREGVIENAQIRALAEQARRR